MWVEGHRRLREGSVNQPTLGGRRGRHTERLQEELMFKEVKKGK